MARQLLELFAEEGTPLLSELSSKAMEMFDSGAPVMAHTGSASATHLGPTRAMCLRRTSTHKLGLLLCARRFVLLRDAIQRRGAVLAALDNVLTQCRAATGACSPAQAAQGRAFAHELLDALLADTVLLPPVVDSDATRA